MTDAESTTRLAPGEAWTESQHERGTYGPDDRDGRTVAFERGTMEVAVLPVRYAREEGRETVTALTRDLDFERRSPASFVSAVPRTTAFATYVGCEPVGSVRQDVVCVADDADDALAVACWLAGAADDDRSLAQHVRVHRGEQGLADPQAGVSDDDALVALFAADPDRCVVTGSPTSSHGVDLPYRYAPLLADLPHTKRGVPRFPDTVRTLAGSVSHRAWEERGFDDVDVSAPLERVDAGEYRLDEGVAAVVEDLDASRFALRRLGD